DHVYDHVRSVAPSFCPTAATRFCTDASTASLVSVPVGERKTRVIVTLFLPFSSGLPRYVVTYSRSSIASGQASWTVFSRSAYRAVSGRMNDRSRRTAGKRGSG